MALMNALLVLSLSSLLVIVALDQLGDLVLPSPLLTLPVQLGAFVVMCLASLVLSVLFVWQNWPRWTVRVSDGPSAEDVLADVISVRLDPVKGLIMDVLDGARIVPVKVNPNYWQFLPSSVLSKSDGLESAVLNSVITNVKPGSEPASLVAISNGESVVGFGSRVKYLGRTYLLTANHVWNGNSSKMFLAKGGIQAEVSLEAPIRFGCFDIKADFVLVEIPDRIWARLEVKAAPLSVMAKQSMVTIYGGSDTKKLVCSSGRANKGEYSHDIVHSCTSTNGWSGSPLYYKNAVVGIHSGTKDLGVSNRGVNVGVLLSNGLETVYSEITNTLIDEEEALDRDYPFLKVDIIGKGPVGIGRGEYYLPRDPYESHGGMKAWENSVRASGRTLWSDDADALESNDTFYDTLETVSGHLNSQRAEPLRRSPPSCLSVITSGSAATSSLEKECHCTELANRVSNLEKLVEKLLMLQSSLPLRSSPNSPTSTGPSEAPLPNLDPSCSKQEGSKKRRNRKTSPKPVTSLGESIPSPKSEVVSEGKTGATAASRRRLRRSAKATLTPKPPPVSHSVSSDKLTVRS